MNESEQQPLLEGFNPYVPKPDDPSEEITSDRALDQAPQPGQKSLEEAIYLNYSLMLDRIVHQNEIEGRELSLEDARFKVQQSLELSGSQEAKLYTRWFFQQNPKAAAYM